MYVLFTLQHLKFQLIMKLMSFQQWRMVWQNGAQGAGNSSPKLGPGGGAGTCVQQL